MLKKLLITIGLLLGLLLPAVTTAQTFSQFQLINQPLGGGVVVSTSTKNGDHLGTIATSSLGLLTTNVAEGINLYFTTARSLSSFITNLAATTSVASITTLPNLSLPYAQLTGTPAGATFGTTSIFATTPLQWNTTTATLSILQAGTSQNGYLSSTDWNTFNGKQAAGNYLTALTGDGTASGPGSAAFTLATVNSNIGTFNNVTLNAKGLATAASNIAYDTFGYLFPSNATTSSLTFGGITLTGASTGCATFTSGVLSSTGVTCGSGSGAVSSVTGTANQVAASPTTGAVVVSLPNHVIFPTGGFESAIASVTNATTTNFEFTGKMKYPGSFDNFLVGVDTNGFANPVGAGPCATGSFLKIITGTGATCDNPTATYPIQYGGGVISTLFGTTTSWGIGNNGFLVLGPTGIPFSAASSTLNLPNIALQNSSVTVNGTAIALGASGTVTANTPNAVTFNSSGSGGSSPQVFNGSSAETISYNTIGAQVAGTYDAVVTATTPIIRSLNNLIFVGLATTSQPASSNILTSNGAAGVYGTATSTLTPSSPLTGSFTQIGSGGSIGCQTASGSQAGCLASADFTTFNNKQTAGNYITALTGDVTASGPGSVAATLATVNSNVGTFTYPSVTVNGKGLITAISNGTAPTTYTGTAPIFVSGSTIGTSFSTSTFNAFAAENTFTNLFATNASSTNATTTNLAITGAASNCGGTNALTTNSIGVVGCTAQPQGTVTAVSVATANGFAGSSSGGSTPALTLSTTITGLLKGNGTAITAATPGTDYDVFGYPFPAGATSSPLTFTGLVTTTNASTTLFSSTYASSTRAFFGTLTLPALATPAGSFLAVNASGQVIATTTPSGGSSTSPGGSDTDVQFNSSGSFGGSDNLTWNGTEFGINDGFNFSYLTAVNGGLLLANATAGPIFIGGDNTDDIVLQSITPGFAAHIDTSVLSADHTFSFPDEDGTLTLGSGFTPGDCIDALDAFTVQDSGAPCGSGGSSFAFPFTVNTGYNSTSTIIGFGAGLFANGSSTFSGPLHLSMINNGTLNIGANTVYSTATSSVTNGTGISFSGTAGALIGGSNLTITNSGVTSNVAGTGIGVSGATGAVTISNTGVTSLAAGTGISLSGSTGAITVTNTGATFGYPFTPSTDGGIKTSATSTPIEGTNPGLGLDVAATSWYGIGGQLLAYASTTNEATIFGTGAGGQNATTSASANAGSAFGSFALSSNTGGTTNSAFGWHSLRNNTTGNNNNAFGGNSLLHNTTGLNNVSNGFQGLNSNTTGNRNTSIGSSALFSSNSDNNIAIGFDAGENIGSGYANIIIGTAVSGSASNITSGAGNIGISNELFFPSGISNNQLDIGNFIFGILPATTTAFKLPTSGTIGIGTTSPFAKFAIQTNNGDTATTLFAIGSSTQTATSTLFSIGNTGAASIFTPTNITNAFGVFNAAGSNVFNIDTTATNPFLGVGTTTPWATASIVGDGTDPLFAVATSSNQGLPNFEIDVNGHEVTSGVKPVCTTSCTFGQGNDNAFRITTGSAVLTEVITFSKSWGTLAPICIATEGGGTASPITVAASSTPTTVTLTNTTLTSKDIDVLCHGIQ